LQAAAEINLLAFADELGGGLSFEGVFM